MPLCEPLTEADFNSWLADGAFGEAGRDIPCEWKQDCFGYLEGGSFVWTTDYEGVRVPRLR
jgi:hypothetical protein